MQSSRLKNWRQRHNSSRTTISLSLCLPPRHTHTHTQCLGANQSWALSNMVDLKNLLFLSHSLSLPPRHSLSHTHTHTHTHLMTWLASILRIVSLSLSITYHPDTHTHTHLMAKIGINSQNWLSLSLSLCWLHRPIHKGPPNSKGYKNWERATTRHSAWIIQSVWEGHLCLPNIHSWLKINSIKTHSWF